MRRREFLFNSAAFGCLAGCLSQGGFAAPRAVVGILTDTHVTPDPSSADLTCRAYALFRRQGVKTVVHAGDLAHRWSAAAYANYVEARRRAYAGVALPEEWHSFGYHDLIDFEAPGQPRDQAERRARAVRAWRDVRARIGVGHELHARFSCGGYTFLVFPQYPDRLLMERMLEETCPANPGRPVFVVEHIPPFDAGPLTRRYDDFEPWTREVFVRYPQVVVLYGHVHSGLRDERCVWQGEFTAVNCGGLTGFQCGYIGRPLASEANESVLTLELGGDGFAFRRWDLRTGEEIGDAWTFVRVADPTSPVPYRLQASAPVEKPRYPAESAVTCLREPSGDVSVAFPEVVGPRRRTYRHRIELLCPGSAAAPVRVDEPGPWSMRQGERRPSHKVRLSGALFEDGAETVVRVTPEDFVGRLGRPLETHYVQKETPWTEVWRGHVDGCPHPDYPEGVDYALPACPASVGRKVCVSFEFAADEDALLSLVDGESHRSLAPSVWGRGDGVFRRYCLTSTGPVRGGRLVIWPNFSVTGRLLVRNVRLLVREDG